MASGYYTGYDAGAVHGIGLRLVWHVASLRSWWVFFLPANSHESVSHLPPSSNEGKLEVLVCPHPGTSSTASRVQCREVCTLVEAMALAVGKVENCPFDSSEVRSLKENVVADLEQDGLGLGRQEGDREDVPIDFRFLGLLLRAAEDPEVGLGQFAQGVRVDPGTRMPRLPALHRPKRKWRLAFRTDTEPTSKRGGSQRRNGMAGGTTQPYSHWPRESICCSDDQTRRGMFIRLLETEARARYPQLVIASLVLIGRTDRTDKSQRGSDETARPGALSNLLRPQEGNAGESLSGTSYVCSHGRCNGGPTARSPLMRGTGTSSAANWSAAQMCSLTRWGRSESHLRRTVGPELPQH